MKFPFDPSNWFNYAYHKFGCSILFEYGSKSAFKKIANYFLKNINLGLEPTILSVRLFSIIYTPLMERNLMGLRGKLNFILLFTPWHYCYTLLLYTWLIIILSRF